MNFLDGTMADIDNHTEIISDYMQRGWSNVRRGSYESAWSNTTPIDNVRSALRVRGSIRQAAVEIKSLIERQKSRLEAISEVEVTTIIASHLDIPNSDELERGGMHDVAIHHDIFEFMKQRRGVATSQSKGGGKAEVVTKLQTSQDSSSIEQVTQVIASADSALAQESKDEDTILQNTL